MVVDGGEEIERPAHERERVVHVAQLGIELSHVRHFSAQMQPVTDFTIEQDRRSHHLDRVLERASVGQRDAERAERVGFMRLEPEPAEDHDRLGAGLQRLLEPTRSPEEDGLLDQGLPARREELGVETGPRQRPVERFDGAAGIPLLAPELAEEPQRFDLGALVVALDGGVERPPQHRVDAGRTRGVEIEARHPAERDGDLTGIAGALRHRAQRFELEPLLLAPTHRTEDVLAGLVRVEGELRMRRDQRQHPAEEAHRFVVRVHRLRRVSCREVGLRRTLPVTGLLAVVGQSRGRQRNVELAQVVGDQAMHAHPIPGVEALVGHVAHDRAREEETTAGAPLNEPALLEGGELLVQLLTAQSSELGHPQAGARHRQPAQGVSLLLRELTQAGRDHVLEGRRKRERRALSANHLLGLALTVDPEDVSVEERVDQLDQEEWIAARAVDDGLLDLVRDPRVAETSGDELAALVLVELVEIDTRHTAQQLLDPLVRAAADDDHQGHFVGVGQEARHELQARHVDELESVDPHHQGALARQSAQKVTNRAGQPGAAIDVVAAARDRRDQGLERVGGGTAQLRGQDLAQRRVDQAPGLVGSHIFIDSTRLADELRHRRVGDLRRAEDALDAQEARIGVEAAERRRHRRALSDAELAEEREIRALLGGGDLLVGVDEGLDLHGAAEEAGLAADRERLGRALLPSASASKAIRTDPAGTDLRGRDVDLTNIRLVEREGAPGEPEDLAARQHLTRVARVAELAGHLEHALDRLVAQAAAGRADGRHDASREPDRRRQGHHQVGREACQRVEHVHPEAGRVERIVHGDAADPDQDAERALSSSVRPVEDRVVLVGDVLEHSHRLRADRAACSLDTGDLFLLFFAPQPTVDHHHVSALAQLTARVCERSLGVGAAGRSGGILRAGHLARSDITDETLQVDGVEHLFLRVEPAGECAGQRAGGLEALLAIERGGAADHLLQIGRDARIDLSRQGELPVPHLLEHLHALLAGVHVSVHQELGQEDPERVDVAPAVHPLPAGLLRRHVGELPLDDARLLADQSRPRDAEVGDLHHALVADEDVLRADVAVHDLHRHAALVLAVVGVVEALGGLHDHERAEGDGDPPALAPGGGEQAAEIQPVDELHGEHGLVPNLFERVHLHDVRVVEAHRDLRLVHEHGQELLAAGEGGQHALDHQDLLDALGAGRRLRQEHLGHATCAQAANDAIAPEGSRAEVRWGPATRAKDNNSGSRRKRRCAMSADSGLRPERARERDRAEPDPLRGE